MQKSKYTKYINTGGPRNSRTFYLRIRLFAISENIPDLKICENCIQLPRLSAILSLFYDKKKCLNFDKRQCLKKKKL